MPPFPFCRSGFPSKASQSVERSVEKETWLNDWLHVKCTTILKNTQLTTKNEQLAETYTNDWSRVVREVDRNYTVKSEVLADAITEIRIWNSAITFDQTYEQ